MKKILARFAALFAKEQVEVDTMKYLVFGLGNIGDEYANTRHNIGFDVLDSLAKNANITFDSNKRYGAIAEYKFKGRTFILVKPSTYMNLSGKAVNYWMQKENVSIENVLVIVDDLALPFGKLRMKQKGGDAGHNGLKHINETLGHNNYTRIRFGISADFSQGQQIDYVLGKWTKEEQNLLNERIDIVIQMIKSFGTVGVERTMNQFNKK